MITEFINGYNVTGNHGTGSVRVYHVCNAAGEVLGRCAGKMLAITHAAARPPGDVPEPKPEPEVPPLKVVTPAPQKKAAAPKPATRKEAK